MNDLRHVLGVLGSVALELPRVQSPERYVKVLNVLCEEMSSGARKCRNLPVEAGMIERREAAEALDEFATYAREIAVDMSNPAIENDELEKRMGEIPKRIEATAEKVMRALVVMLGIDTSNMDTATLLKEIGRHGVQHT